MTGEAMKNARDSLDRCMAREGFLDSFYNRFLQTSPVIAKKFEGTDFERQKDVLSQSLHLMLVGAGATEGPAFEELKRIGHVHNRENRDITPDLYDVWLESLMDTVREFDGMYTPELESDWRSSLKPGIDLLISRY